MTKGRPVRAARSHSVRMSAKVSGSAADRNGSARIQKKARSFGTVSAALPYRAGYSFNRFNKSWVNTS